MALRLLAFAALAASSVSAWADCTTVAPDSLENYVELMNKTCDSETMLYDYNTAKCFSPALHPSVFNCAFSEQKYDEEAEECVPCPEAPKCVEDNHLLWNPETNNCYNPAAHPSDINCMIYGLSYNPETQECAQCPDTNQANAAPTCDWGKLPSLDKYGKPTGQCSECGWCEAYHNLGQPACSADNMCTLICPWGTTVHSKWGALYCS